MGAVMAMIKLKNGRKEEPCRLTRVWGLRANMGFRFTCVSLTDHFLTAHTGHPVRTRPVRNPAGRIPVLPLCPLAQLFGVILPNSRTAFVKAQPAHAIFLIFFKIFLWREVGHLRPDSSDMPVSDFSHFGLPVSNSPERHRETVYYWRNARPPSFPRWFPLSSGRLGFNQPYLVSRYPNSFSRLIISTIGGGTIVSQEGS